MVNTSATFRSWLKASTNMKLSSDTSVLRVTHEGITSYDNLVDFDKAAIKNLPRACKGSIDAISDDIANNVQAKAAEPGANVPYAIMIMQQSNKKSRRMQEGRQLNQLSNLSREGNMVEVHS